MKVCIYLRKSRADRDHPGVLPEDVLKNHEAILLAFADKNCFEIADIKKEVVSGESLARRPEMLKLLEEVEDGLFDAVLVKDFDRLGRGSMMEQGIIIEAFRKSATKIITPEKTYDLENEFDEEYIDLSAFFARKELKMITKRLHSGRIKSVSDGNYISPHAPYGYDKQNKSLVINEPEASAVRLIFELYTDRDYGAAAIAKYLSDHGIPNKHGGPDWDKTTVRNILRNPVYTGKITWNKREYRYQSSGKRTSRFASRLKWKIYNGKHGEIIGAELFERAQQAAGQRRALSLHTSKPLRNPLANLLKCGGCGASMTIRTAAGRPDTLRCYRNCGKSAGSYLSAAEERLISLLALYLKEHESLFQYINDTHGVKKEVNADQLLAYSLESYKNRKKKLELQRGKIYDLLEQGIYDRDTFLTRLEILTESLRLIENRIETARSRPAGQMGLAGPEPDARAESSPFQNITEFLHTVYRDLDAKNRNDFLRALTGSVIYTKPKGAKKDGFTLQIILNV